MFKDFSDLIRKLESTNGRIEKENYLAEYRTNDTVRNLLFFTFNPYIITGISKKKASKYINTLEDLSGVETIDSVLDFTDYFTLHKSGRDEDLKVLEKFARQHEEYRSIIYRLATKDIKVGVQATTLNKIFGKNFVPVFEVMLGDRYFDNPDKYVPEGKDFILTQKLDGVRCVCIKDNDGTVTFLSRQGQPINDLVDVEKEVREGLPAGFVYDGELLLRNDAHLRSKDLYRQTVKVTSSDNVKKNIIFNCFDILPVDEFRRGFCAHSSYTRKIMLQNYINRKNFEWIKEVKMLYTGCDKEQITNWLDKIVSEGGEGVMINLFDAPYECKRSRGLLKVKKMQTCDIKCIDVAEGTGHNKDKLGAVVCEFIGPDEKTYIVNVGSGFTLQDREYFWKTPEAIVGKIIEVQYFEISQNEQGGYSLRFPVFKHIREEKTEISMY